MRTTLFSDNFEGISGNHFFHFGSCLTRLWFFHRNIEVGLDNVHIQIGKQLDIETHARNKKRLVIPGLCSIDYVKKEDHLEIHEIKKGKEESNAHLYQVMYYLEVANELTDMDCIGYIHYPQIKEVLKVKRKPELIAELYEKIQKIVKSECPTPKRIPICKGCSYAEMCFS